MGAPRVRTFLNNEKRARFLIRTAKEVKSYQVQKKVLLSLLAMLITITGTFYMLATLYERTGSFTVGINKVDMVREGIALCETADLSQPSSHLNAEVNEHITNISEDWIPENVDSVDGVHNGDNYIAYTFYLFNSGELFVNYEYSINVSNVTNNLDEAIRIRLYVDGAPTTYAKTKSDGSGPEPGTVEFYSANAMARGRFEDLRPGDSKRFTVVIWIEGNDPECLDWLIGGQLRVEMDLRVAH
jgi:subtilase family serine protease